MTDTFIKLEEKVAWRNTLRDLMETKPDSWFIRAFGFTPDWDKMTLELNRLTREINASVA